ncbi:MAG: FAD-dependent oxidoreductase, partial [Halobacteriales archaeon]
MTPSVAVLGGGVGGLTAGHELASRGFDVTVYEAAADVGGKARSFAVPGTGDPGLPGEHGFRFFPGFYRHMTATMADIPDGEGNTVADHLVPTAETLLADRRDAAVESTTTPSSVSEWVDRLQPGDDDIPAGERAFLAERMLELLTSCERRRREEFDERTWWEFLSADRMSDAYKRQVSATRSLVALAPQRASARTVGRIYVQLLRGQLDPQLQAERILDGPTSEVWLRPWREHLASMGVEVVTEAPATAFHVEGNALAGATVERDGGSERVTADYYVAAVPVEAMAALLTEDLTRVGPELAGIERLD